MTNNQILDRYWDSESHSSPFSTVSDPFAADFCEECETEVDYSDPTAKHGTCKCDGGGH